MAKSFPIIVKPSANHMMVKPNLDYDQVAPAFGWEDIYRELDWLPGGWLNGAHEAIDRHADGALRDKTAMVWEGVNGERETYTFGQMKTLTDRFANVLNSLGVVKGDRVTIFLERVPELYIAFFGILKVGAIAVPLFSALGPDSLKDRMLDSVAKILITQPDLRRSMSGTVFELFDLQHIIVVNKDNRDLTPLEMSDLSYEEEMSKASVNLDIVPTSQYDYSTLHYTSGTTGKPKGVLHRHEAVAQLYATGKWVLDLHEDDIYWCTADAGWAAGTSYGILAPWANGVTQLIYEGGFEAGAWYEVIQRHKVTVWYTTPTAIGMLMKAGDEMARRYDLSSLRHLCSVGEPLNPEAIAWSERVFGKPFHDSWWQTETGAVLIANYPGVDVRPGSMGRPIPGVRVAILDDGYNPVPPDTDGHLAARPGLPSMFTAYWNNTGMYHARFRKGWYMTGDRARVDRDGYFWSVGRGEDVISVEGRVVGAVEVESVLMEHPAVAEAGVIAKPDPGATGVVKAFVALKDGHEPTGGLRKEITRLGRQRLAEAVAPREIEFVPSLPNTRSGQIMRRVLRARELDLPEGDTSTLAEGLGWSNVKATADS